MNMTLQEKKTKLAELQTEYWKVNDKFIEDYLRSYEGKELFKPYPTEEQFPESMKQMVKEMRQLDHEIQQEEDDIFEPIPESGDVMSFEDFKKSVETGGFIDYDGYGHYGKNGQMVSNKCIRPSNIKENQVLEGYDTIIWFNR